mmetsp:Transcript_51682/g.143091  ORF Transcript_51682/g.143091 Transcript_51682/m.143091 type:complete len:319 (+) Transcript_51682:146-1102(+)
MLAGRRARLPSSIREGTSGRPLLRPRGPLARRGDGSKLDLQGVSLSVQHPAVEVQRLARREGQEEVLHRLGEPPRRLGVLQRSRNLAHVLNLGIAIRRPGVLLDGVEDVAGHAPVLGIACVVVHVEEGLGGLRPKHVLRSVLRDLHVLARRRLEVESEVLRGQARRCAVVHLVARLGQLGGEGLPGRIDLLRRKGPRPQHQHARDEAREVVHVGAHLAHVVDLGEERSAARRAPNQAPLHLLHGLPPLVLERGLLLPCLNPVLEKVLVVGVAGSSDRRLAGGESRGLGIAGKSDRHQAAASGCLENCILRPVCGRDVL